MRHWFRSILPYLGALVFFAAWAQASVEQRSRDIWEPWQTEVAGDALGYYAYLPALFTYGMRTEAMPKAMNVRLNEFYCHIDQEKDRVVIQYTYVVALLELPFFCIAELIEGWGRTDGFTKTHADLLAVAGIFYWSLGLLALAFALRRWRPIGRIALLLVFLAGCFGTNLFYYAFRMPGYAHIHCFFLLSVSLWAMLTGMEGSRGKRVVFVLAAALLMVARPLDACAIAVLWAWYWSRVRERGRWRELIMLQLLAIAIVAFPQLLYWHDTHGTWLHYSYEQQGFTNWNDPEILNVLYSPANGLLPWSPMFLSLPFGLWAMWRAERTLAIAISVCFALVIYACASWWVWQFGCAFGQRSFAQYAVFLIVVLWNAAGEARTAPIWLKALCAVVLVLTCRTVYFMSLEYAGCYFGEPDDWQPWAELVARAIK